MDLHEYQERAFLYSAIDWNDSRSRQIAPLGLLSELGSLAGEAKKIIRDGAAYTEGLANLKVEYGDVLWYLSALSTQAEISLAEIPLPDEASPEQPELCLYALGEAISALVVKAQVVLKAKDPVWSDLGPELRAAVQAVRLAIKAHGLDLSGILVHNLEKGESYFGRPSDGPAPCHDEGYKPHEQLPRLLKIQVLELRRGEGKREVILRVNDLNVGDRLTDNAAEDDGYRFHDAFHFAYVAVLGWSPVSRALFKCKRKSNPEVDEIWDGARAAIMEEAITHAMWEYARGASMLQDVKRIDHNILTLIQRMVRGLKEVNSTPLRDWQRAFFVGFEAFRALQQNGGGWLLLDADRRSLTYSREEPTLDLSRPLH